MRTDCFELVDMKFVFFLRIVGKQLRRSCAGSSPGWSLYSVRRRRNTPIYLPIAARPGCLPHHFVIMFLKPGLDEYLPESIHVMGRYDLTKICQVDRVGMRLTVDVSV